MMGGKDFVVQHLNWFSPTEGVICRWEARGALCLLGTQGQLAGWGLPTQAPPFLPPATLTGLRRASRPSDTWIPLDVCTVCPPCCMRQAASPSHSPWTMVAPFHAPGPGWLVSPALLSLGGPTGNYPRHASPASPAQLLWLNQSLWRCARPGGPGFSSSSPCLLASTQDSQPKRGLGASRVPWQGGSFGSGKPGEGGEARAPPPPQPLSFPDSEGLGETVLQWDLVLGRHAQLSEPPEPQASAYPSPPAQCTPTKCQKQRRASW